MASRQEKRMLDKVAAKVSVKRKETTSAAAGTKSATTDDGRPIEEQVRKEWNPKTDGGLPMPLK